MTLNRKNQASQQDKQITPRITARDIRECEKTTKNAVNSRRKEQFWNEFENKKSIGNNSLFILTKKGQQMEAAKPPTTPATQ